MQVMNFLISNFRRVLYVLCFILGNSPASEFIHTFPGVWIYSDAGERA